MLKILLDNPEFKKNLWMELSPNRLILMPLVLGAIFFMTYLSSDHLFEYMDSLKTVSAVTFGILIFIWGSKMVSESIINEVNENTWDFQRMTSIGPWEMSLGKLFGTTIYPWYGAGFCIAAYLIAGFYLPKSFYHIKFLTALVLTGVLTHAITLSASIMGIRKNKANEKLNSSLYFISAIVVLVFLLPNIISASYKIQMDIYWYLFNVSYINCIIFSIIFFLFWAVIGLYRNMRSELQMLNGPWIWIIFIFSLMIYCSGFIANIRNMEIIDRFLLGLYMSYAIAIFITYCMAFSEPKDIVDFRLVMSRINNNQWNKAGEIFPLWGMSCIISLIIFAVIFIMSLIFHGIEIPGEEAHISGLYSFNLLCFMVRDLSLLIYVNLKENSPRADVATIVYLMILYLLIPMIIGLSDIKSLLAVFVPTFDSNFINGTIPILIQTIVMFYFMFNRYKLRNRKIDERQ